MVFDSCWELLAAANSCRRGLARLRKLEAESDFEGVEFAFSKEEMPRGHPLGTVESIIVIVVRTFRGDYKRGRETGGRHQKPSASSQRDNHSNQI